MALYWEQKTYQMGYNILVRGDSFCRKESMGDDQKLWIWEKIIFSRGAKLIDIWKVSLN